MANLKRYAPLAFVAAAGVVAMVLAGIGLLAVRGLLEDRGYGVSPFVSIIVFFGVVGGLYGAFAKLALREVRKLGRAKDGAASS